MENKFSYLMHVVTFCFNHFTNIYSQHLFPFKWEQVHISTNVSLLLGHSLATHSITETITRRNSLDFMGIFQFETLPFSELEIFFFFVRTAMLEQLVPEITLQFKTTVTNSKVPQMRQSSMWEKKKCSQCFAH